MGKITPLKWDPKALKACQEARKRLGLLQLELLEQRIEALKTWPPEDWYDLKDKFGMIRFQTDPDQFVGLNGIYENGTVYITRFELRSNRRA
jgi:hypothetical protein